MNVGHVIDGGSHLSELQLSGCLNMFSKATPTISGYFR